MTGCRTAITFLVNIARIIVALVSFSYESVINFRLYSGDGILASQLLRFRRSTRRESHAGHTDSRFNHWRHPWIILADLATHQFGRNYIEMVYRTTAGQPRRCLLNGVERTVRSRQQLIKNKIHIYSINRFTNSNFKFIYL